MVHYPSPRTHFITPSDTLRHQQSRPAPAITRSVVYRPAPATLDRDTPAPSLCVGIRTSCLSGVTDSQMSCTRDGLVRDVTGPRVTETEDHGDITVAGKVGRRCQVPVKAAIYAVPRDCSVGRNGISYGVVRNGEGSCMQHDYLFDRHLIRKLEESSSF